MDPNPLVETLLAQAAEAAARARRPESTYRLQFHAGFTFRDATAIVPYLRDLGITHVYASPYLKARPGSTHGYDIIDHGCLNPEIGTDGGLRGLGRRPARRTAWARSSTPCPTTWASAPTRTPGGTTCWRTARPRRYGAYFDIAWRLAPPGAPGQGAARRPGRPLRRGPGGRPARAGLRRRGVLDPLLRPPVPGRRRAATPRSWRTGSTSWSAPWARRTPRWPSIRAS